MAIAYSNRYTSYSPVLATDAFSVGFPIFSVSDITVVVDGVETEDYSVSATFAGGKSEDAEVVLNSTVVDVDVEIYGDRQPARVAEYSAASPDVIYKIQEDLDAITAVVQELYRDTGRYIRMPIGGSESRDVNENADARAGSFLGFDGAGNVTASLSGPTGTPVSSFMESFLTEVDSASAISTLDVDGGYLSKSTNYTITTNDSRKTVEGTAVLTLSLPAVLTAGSDFWIRVFANGGDVVIDPDGGELVNGQATITILDGSGAMIRCNGSGWLAVVGSVGGGSISEIDGLSLSEGDLLVRGASEMESLAIGSPNQLVRVNAAGTGLEYADGGWELISTPFLGLTAPSQIEAADLEDGYEYRLFLVGVSVSVAAYLNVEIYKEDDAAYHATSLQCSTGSAAEFYGFVDFKLLRNTTSMKMFSALVLSTGSISNGTDSGDSGSALDRQGTWTLSTSQKVSKVRISPSTGNFNASGYVALYGRQG